MEACPVVWDKRGTGEIRSAVGGFTDRHSPHFIRDLNPAPSVIYRVITMLIYGNFGHFPGTEDEDLLFFNIFCSGIVGVISHFAGQRD